MESRSDTSSSDATHFADPSRAMPEILARQVTLACGHPVVTSLLETIGGMVLVLNSCRQVVATNTAFLQRLGFTDPSAALGLRPGEVMGCTHASTAPNGCGTGLGCLSCGAALSILSAARGDGPSEQRCVIRRLVHGMDMVWEFSVRSTRLVLEEHPFVVVTLTDISHQVRAETIERMFVHDLLNCVQALQSTSDLLLEGEVADGAFGSRFRDLVGYLTEVIASHRDLSLVEEGRFQVNLQAVTVEELYGRVRCILAHSGAAQSKTLHMLDEVAEPTLTTDPVLVTRVLVNMLKNALEATPRGGSVSLRARACGPQIEFLVWNVGEIPPVVAARVFERHFSTKGGVGRGLGTYSMKRLGEGCLGGTVGFVTGENGTTFTFTLPRA